MKKYSVVVLGCIIMLLNLFGCNNGVPPVLDEVILEEGTLEVAKDFYTRNKPEPVVVDYSVKLIDGSETKLGTTIGIKVDLFRFDVAAGDFVPEQNLAEDPFVTVTFDANHIANDSDTINWVYDRQVVTGTYKIILEATMEGFEEPFSTVSDLFVIWKSPGAPKGHAKRDLKKMDQVEKLITKLDGYHGIYEEAQNLGYIVGDELVVIHDEMMTVDEAVDMAETFEMNAIENSNEAMEYFDAQDYETCFILAKTAAREAHQALNIYHALLAQAKDAME